MADGKIVEPGVYDPPSDIRSIPISRCHTAIVDAVDYGIVAHYRWYLLRGHNGKVYAYAKGSSTAVLYLHRLIIATPPGYETDHVNGDGLDNRRINLRVATASQNRANMGKPRRPGNVPPSSIFKGVSWDKSRSRWLAKIQYLGRHYNLGRFTDESEAAQAYDAAAIAYWREFAQLNFPVGRP